MGRFYCNVTLLGTDLEAVRAVAPQPAFLATEGDAVVVFAEADDEGAPVSGEHLSSALNCLALSAAIHDDDIFMFEVHDRGRSLVGGAVPDPAEYFGVDPDMFGDLDPSMLEDIGPPPSGDAGAPDATALVGAVQRGDVDAVRQAFAEDFVFATDRHEAIAMALGLPLAAVGWGYRYLLEDGDDGPSVIRI